MEAIGDAPGIGGPNYCEVCGELSPGHMICKSCRDEAEQIAKEEEADRIRDEEAIRSR